MQGLMLKLLNVDAAGERALRVVSYFDQLGMHDPDLDAVVRATAVIADCPAGICLLEDSAVIRFTPEGIRLESVALPTAQSLRLDTGSEGTEHLLVWLERPHGVIGELDEFILERMDLAARAVLHRRQAPQSQLEPTGMSDPALVQVLLSERTNEAERSRAARLLGLDPASPVSAVALTSNPEGSPGSSLERRLRASWGRAVHVAEISQNITVAIAVGSTEPSWADLTYEARGAIGPVVTAVDASASWERARAALNLAGTSVVWPRLLRASDVGSLQLLLKLDADEVARNADVRLIERLSQGAGGAETLRLLDYVVHFDSLRSAAREANFHHSSLQARVARLERDLGFNFRSGAGRDRIALALVLWRLYVAPSFDS